MKNDPAGSFALAAILVSLFGFLTYVATREPTSTDKMRACAEACGASDQVMNSYDDEHGCVCSAKPAR